MGKGLAHRGGKKRGESLRKSYILGHRLANLIEKILEEDAQKITNAESGCIGSDARGKAEREGREQGPLGGKHATQHWENVLEYWGTKEGDRSHDTGWEEKGILGKKFQSQTLATTEYYAGGKKRT